MGYMIGKGGSRFREIEEASAARLKAQEHVLPNSTDRVLFVQGVADAIHIAVYYLCITYISHKVELRNTHPRFYDPASTQKQPQLYGPPSYQPPQYSASGSLPYGGLHYPQPYLQPYEPVTPKYRDQPFQPGAPRRSLGSNSGLNKAHVAAQSAPRGEELSQEVYIPNDFVGSVIGKGGSKIKEIRRVSGSRVTVTDPLPESTERLVRIIGAPQSNETAIYLIHSLIESEKKRASTASMTSKSTSNEAGESSESLT